MKIEMLKLGIILDSYDVPAWIYYSIKRIIDANCARFLCVLLNGNNVDGNEKPSLVFRMFNALDEMIFVKRNNALETMNLGKLLSEAPEIKVHLGSKENTSEIEPSIINEILGFGLDILIKISSAALQGDILSTARYGVWAYKFNYVPHGFWEVVEKKPETKVELLSLNKDENRNRIIYSSSSSTYPFSPARNRNRSLWKFSSFLPRQIALLRVLGEKEFFLDIEKFNQSIEFQIKEEAQSIKSGFLSFRMIMKIMLNNFRELINRVCYLDAWYLKFDLSNAGSSNFQDYQNITPPKEKFWADPHITQVNGTYYIFIEEFSREKNKGHISVIELDNLGNWKPPVTVLEKDYHLSYPFILECNGKFYMVPESRENKSIDLYECVDFPHQWVFKQCLMNNVSAVDSTIVRFSNKWWLFTALAENEAAAPGVELFLFFADDLFSGNWIAHPKNPIITSDKSARPAGSLFFDEGKLFRPSQDCSAGYGYGIDLNEIDVLTETEFSERKVISIEPDKQNGILGMHTYARCNNLIVIDTLTRIARIG